MKQTTKIRSEIESLEIRRAQLAGELSKASQAHNDSQATLVKTGSDEAMKQAATAFASFKSLEEAVLAIDKQLEEKQQQLFEAEEFERNAATRARIAECQREIDEAQEEYQQGCDKAHRVLVETLPGTFEAYKRHQALWRELKGLRPPSQDERDYDSIKRPTLEPFGFLLDQALQVLSNIEQRGTRADRKALANERNKRAREAEERRLEERAARAREAAKRPQNLLGQIVSVPQRVA